MLRSVSRVQPTCAPNCTPFDSIPLVQFKFIHNIETGRSITQANRRTPRAHTANPGRQFQLPTFPPSAALSFEYRPQVRHLDRRFRRLTLSRTLSNMRLKPRARQLLVTCFAAAPGADQDDPTRIDSQRLPQRLLRIERQQNDAPAAT